MLISARSKLFKKSFFPYCINIWNNLKVDIRNAKSISIFKKLIVSKQYGNSLFSLYDPLGEKFLTRLKLRFSHLKEGKVRHGFADTMLKLRNTFFCAVTFNSTQRFEFFDNLERANPDFENLSDKDQVSFMLYGSKANTFGNFNQNSKL